MSATTPTLTTFVFSQPQFSAFAFQPSLDGVTYTATVTWNLFGQRYYVNVFDSSGNLILSVPRIASPAAANISLTAGYFISSMVWRETAGWFEVLDVGLLPTGTVAAGGLNLAYQSTAATVPSGV